MEIEVDAGEPAQVDYVPPRGAPGLRDMIAARYHSIRPDDIVLASGASEVLAAIAHAFAPRRVAIDRGVYESFIAAAERLGSELLEASPGDGAVDADLTVLCNPTVPDGRLRDLHSPATGRLVVDEVELDFVHVRRPVFRAADRIAGGISVNSLSKSLGLGGLRVGWAACRDEDALAAIDREVQLLSGGPAGPSVAAAEAALRCYDDWIVETRAALADNAPAVYDVLRQAGWRFERPEAGLTVECTPPLPIDAPVLDDLKAAGLFIVPGSVYGTPATCRVSLLAPVEGLERACAIVAGKAGACEPNATPTVTAKRLRDSGDPTLTTRQ
jgi:aspartate/methionine/tyrosine aminotransferase